MHSLKHANEEQAEEDDLSSSQGDASSLTSPPLLSSSMSSEDLLSSDDVSMTNHSPGSSLWDRFRSLFASRGDSAEPQRYTQLSRSTRKNRTRQKNRERCQRHLHFFLIMRASRLGNIRLVRKTLSRETSTARKSAKGTKEKQRDLRDITEISDYRRALYGDFLRTKRGHCVFSLRPTWLRGNSNKGVRICIGQYLFVL